MAPSQNRRFLPKLSEQGRNEMVHKPDINRKSSAHSRIGLIEVSSCRVGGDGVDEIGEIKKEKHFHHS